MTLANTFPLYARRQVEVNHHHHQNWYSLIIIIIYLFKSDFFFEFHFNLFLFSYLSIYEQVDDDAILIESCTEEDNEDIEDDNVLDNSKYVEDAPTEIRDLLSKKIELERRQRHQELHRQRAQVRDNNFLVIIMLF